MGGDGGGETVIGMKKQMNKLNLRKIKIIQKE